MISKTEKTIAFILDKVRPIFNKNGYAASSMAEITKATGLTKGAIYGNFKNKEALALASFNYNVHFILDKIKEVTKQFDSSLDKLFAITNFYRTYYKHNIAFGGCPILNAGVDLNYTNPILFKQVQKVYKEIKNNISKIIIKGQEINEINRNIDVSMYAGLFLSQIEGAVFTAVMLRDDTYLINMMDYLDQMITKELKIEGNTI